MVTEECDCGWCGRCYDQHVWQQEMEKYGDDDIREVFSQCVEEDE